jgi:uncharacterized protein (DUF3084 family)
MCWFAGIPADRAMDLAMNEARLKNYEQDLLRYEQDIARHGRTVQDSERRCRQAVARGGDLA